MSKAQIAELLRRVEVIELETGDGKPAKKKKGKDDPNDEFTVLKKEIAHQITEIRKEIKERDDMNAKKVGRKEIVEKSAHVRQLVRQVKEDANRLRQVLAQQERKKVKGKPLLTEEKRQVRQDMVKLTFDHIEECEQLEKRRYTADKNDKARSQLLGAPSTSSKVAYGRSAVETDLMDLDDPEIEEGLARLRRKNEELDQDLDTIGKGVSELNQIALHMNNEVKLQNSMIDEMQHKVDKTRAHLQNTNKRMKELLDKVASPSKFCVDIVLFIVLLGLITFIINMVVNKNFKL